MEYSAEKNHSGEFVLRYILSLMENFLSEWQSGPSIPQVPCRVGEASPGAPAWAE